VRKAPAISDRRWAINIAALYGLIVGLWMLVQSGFLPKLILAPVLELEVEEAAWVQTANGWFFVVSTAWLLYLLIMRNLRTQRAAEAELRLRDRAIEASINAVMITEARGRNNPLVYVNPAFATITGYGPEQALGKDPRFLHREDASQPGLAEIRAATREERAGRAVLRNYRADGSLFWGDLHIAPVKDDEDRITHYVGVLNDITEAKGYEEALAYQANYDALTGLPNRALIEDRIGQALSHAARYRQTVAVAILDLDNFKLVNDTLGRSGADQVLRQIPGRITPRIRTTDTLGRLAGDEFLLLSYEHGDAAGVSAELRRVQEAFAEPFRVGEREIYATFSVGVSLFPQDGRDAESLIRNAAAAVHRAKEIGRGMIQFYAPELDARITERFELGNRLRRALPNGELLLHYQPQIELAGGRVVGVEALIRWQSPEMGTVPPGKFIPLAEEIELIEAIGEWAMRSACQDNRQWQQAGLAPLTVGVNVSAQQFRRHDLVTVAARVLHDTQLDPQYLELELTEGILMEHSEDVLGTLRTLRNMGVRLAVDDFGTGYSSLSYLRRFPIHRLKIDKSFVGDATTSPDAAAVAKAVITLGHSLGLKVIAEGVETREQLAFLRQAGCDEVQGYLVGRPSPAGEIARLLAEKRIALPD
jgi:diguanylate cyclase (GGDEF)-like protein/PAS domain S-box-containing protein